MNQDQQKTQGNRPGAGNVISEAYYEASPQISGPPQRNDRDYQLPGAPEGLGTLVNGVIADVQDILRNEVRLAQAELKEDAGILARAAAMGVVSAVAGLVGFIILMIGVSLLLTRWLDDWLAFVIGGAALLIIAGILATIAKSRLSAANLKPERTIDSLQQDKAWAQEQAQTLKEEQK